MQKAIHGDTAINSQPCHFREAGPRSYADAGDNEISGQRFAAAKFHLVAIDTARDVLHVKNDAVLLVKGPDKIAHLWTHNPPQWLLVGCNDLDVHSARAQGGGDLEADKTGAKHDDALGSLGLLNYGPTIGKRA
ncbi:hypothetical protein AJ87_40410 [Rhizobium yanglingense]|nr:hypothetical protein AJ87_40410 [Rhizobium yanglingense]